MKGIEWSTCNDCVAMAHYANDIGVLTPRKGRFLSVAFWGSLAHTLSANEFLDLQDANEKLPGGSGFRANSNGLYTVFSLRADALCPADLTAWFIREIVPHPAHFPSYQIDGGNPFHLFVRCQVCDNACRVDDERLRKYVPCPAVCWGRRPWADRDVVAVAAACDKTMEVDAFHALADALEDSGCNNPLVYAHLRGGQACSSCRNGFCSNRWAHVKVHARGCWVVDAILEAAGQ